METEEELLKAIRQGERAALKRLYDRYSGYAAAIVLRYVPDGDDMRDVLQDSFVKILTSIQQFRYRGEGSLKSWVSSIVCHKAIDFLRERKRLTFVSEIPEETDEEEPDIEQISPEKLMELIGMLPPNYRLVLNLFVFEQVPHREIARQLGIKEKTSSSMFFRAKRMLAKLIKEASDASEPTYYGRKKELIVKRK